MATRWSLAAGEPGQPARPHGGRWRTSPAVPGPCFRNAAWPLAGRIGREHHVLQDGDPPHQVELLKDEAEGRPADPGEKPLRQAGDLHLAASRPPGKTDAAPISCSTDPSRGGPGHAADQGQERGFPGTARPLQHRDPPRLDACRLTSSTAVNWFGLPALNDFGDIGKFDHGHDLMAASGSTVAARQDGMMVATV